MKTSVRVCNLSLLNTDWYTEQMAQKQNDSEALPIMFTPDQYLQNEGNLDAIVMKVGGSQISDQDLIANPNYSKMVLRNYVNWDEKKYTEYMEMLISNNMD